MRTRQDGLAARRRLVPCLGALLTLAQLATGAAFGSGETVPLNTFDLPPGASVTITFRVGVDNPLGVCAGAVANQGTLSGANFPALMTDDPDTMPAMDATVTGLDVADLAVTKSLGAPPVPGAMASYTIVVSNAGPSAAIGATVTDAFPAQLSGVTWTCAATAGSACTAAGAGDIGEVVTVAAGGDVTFTATGLIDPGATGTLDNTASVTPPANTLDCDPSNNSVTVMDPLAPTADLAITKDDGVASVSPGEMVTYTIQVGNSGPSDALGATVTDTFPVLLGGVTWTCAATAGSSCTAAGAGDISDVVNVLVGGMVTYTATGTIDPGATGMLSNTASVAPPAGTTDPNGANDSATDTDTLTPSADLAIEKTGPMTPPIAGFTYMITVTNDGPSDATGVVVTDNLPAGLTFVQTTGCAEDPNGVPTCTLGDVPAGGMASYDVEVTIDPMPPASVSNTATVAGNEPDPNAANDSDTEVTTLDAEPPTVTNVDTVADTGDGTLDDCETARAEVTQILLTFSEDVQDNGAGDPDSVTNPANYRLVAPAMGAGFDTMTCLDPPGGDTAVVIDGVSYDAGSFTATLNVNGGVPLADSQYRLLVCGTTSIVDAAGNALDGDEDGTGGDDFLRDFRIDAANLFANGEFDCDLGGWTTSVPANVEQDPGTDTAGVPISGSAHNADPFNGFDLFQCVPVGSQQELHLEASVRADLEPEEVIAFEIDCLFHATVDCTAGPLGRAYFPNLLRDTTASGRGWVDFSWDLTTPAGAASAFCQLRVASPQGDPYDAFLDDVFLGESTMLFRSSFEDGAMGGWTLVVEE